MIPVVADSYRRQNSVASDHRPPTEDTSITQLLAEWRDGDRDALDRLMPLVYTELRSLASRLLSQERPGHTLQATAIIHEAYVKLAGYEDVEWRNRAHFFAIAASVIRHLLVDHARAKGRNKRGGAAVRLSIDDAPDVALRRSPDLVALDDALLSLHAVEPRYARVVELRFFGGLSVEEAAEVMNLSPATVKRDWTMARAILFRDLKQRDC